MYLTKNNKTVISIYVRNVYLRKLTARSYIRATNLKIRSFEVLAIVTKIAVFCDATPDVLAVN
jgi:hypothetical protein